MVASPPDSISQIRARLGSGPGRPRAGKPGGDRVLLIALAAVGIAVAGFSLIRGANGDAGRSATVEVSDTSSPADTNRLDGAGGGAGAEGDDPAVGASGPSTSAPGPSIRVHVAGAVLSPGVYALPAGAIGDEAVAAAGGALAEAELGRVNLAGKLADGQQFYVPRKGEAIPETGASGGRDGAGAGAGAGGAPVNLNTASIDALDGLPGIGAATAQKIVDYRTKHGPFKDVRQLLDVPGIGEGKLAALEGLVTT